MPTDHGPFRQAMPDSTRVYDGVGRMFVLNDVPTVRKNLQKKQTSHKEKITKLEVRKSPTGHEEYAFLDNAGRQNNSIKIFSEYQA